jgi:hypothetical protein
MGAVEMTEKPERSYKRALEGPRSDECEDLSRQADRQDGGEG